MPGVPGVSVAWYGQQDIRRAGHRALMLTLEYVRAILVSTRYAGRQVWNRQRKDEVLPGVHDVALGHAT
jgi:site-specific DNA recombinase